MRSLLQNSFKKNTFKKVYFLLFSFIFIFLFYDKVFADEFTSSSYKVIDPVIAPAGFSTSTNFQLSGSISETAVGTSSSASYNLGAGFLRFPSANNPAISLATPLDSAVALSWSASTGYLGWTISSYSVGKATVSGGPYTYTNVGNVTTYSQTGLTNNVPYYFVIVANDFFGNAVATSTEVMATPVSSGFTFTLDTNTVYFGSLNSSATVYGSSTNINGSSVEVTSNVIEVNTGASNGYTVTVRGQTLTSLQNPSNIINPLLSNTSPSIGSEQFGLRLTSSGGIGAVTSPYDASGFAYLATATTTSQIAGASSGNNATTTYQVRYMANIAPITKAGNYTANLVYVATANF